MTTIEVLKPFIFLSEARNEGDKILVRDASLIRSLISDGYVKVIQEEKKVASKATKSTTNKKKAS